MLLIRLHVTEWETVSLGYILLDSYGGGDVDPITLEPPVIATRLIYPCDESVACNRLTGIYGVPCRASTDPVCLLSLIQMVACRSAARIFMDMLTDHHKRISDCEEVINMTVHYIMDRRHQISKLHRQTPIGLSVWQRFHGELG